MTLIEQIRKMKIEALKNDIRIKILGMDRKTYEVLKEELEVMIRYSNQLEHENDYITLYGIDIHPIDKD